MSISPYHYWYPIQSKRQRTEEEEDVERTNERYSEVFPKGDEDLPKLVWKIGSEYQGGAISAMRQIYMHVLNPWYEDEGRKETTAAFMCLGGPAKVAKAMKKNIRSVAFRNEALRFCIILSEYPDFCRAWALTGIMEFALKVISEFPDNEETAFLAPQLLSLIIQEVYPQGTTYIADFVKMDMLSILTNNMKRHPDNTQVQEQSSHIMYWLSTFEGATRAMFLKVDAMWALTPLACHGRTNGMLGLSAPTREKRKNEIACNEEGLTNKPRKRGRKAKFQM